MMVGHQLGKWGIEMRIVFGKRPLITLASWLLLALLPFAAAQNADAVIDYMLEHHVGFGHAAQALGIDSIEAQRELGYGGVDDIFRAHFETSLLHADCLRLAVSLQGSAEELGLTVEGLTQYFRLRLANDLSFVPDCGSDYLAKYLQLVLTVWTVGDDYPVAIHLELNGSLYPDYIGRPPTSVESASLGYGAATNVETSVRRFIAAQVEDLALTFLKVRGFSKGR